jgi:glutathione S-transferase
MRGEPRTFACDTPRATDRSNGTTTMPKIWGRRNSINVMKVPWVCEELALPFERIDAGMQFGVVNTPEDKRDPKVIAANATEAERCMRILDEQLAGRPHLAGEGFTLADVPAAAFVHRWLELPIERPVLPRLEADYRPMPERPGYRDHVALEPSRLPRICIQTPTDEHRPLGR